MITCCNLISGAVAVMLAAEGRFDWAFIFILIGAGFDFFDGMSARALKVSSPIGKELDSLADNITFGLAPSVMLMQSIRLSTEHSNYVWGWWAALALIMAAFSALRLAKFNLDERQTSSFIGLATPANAIFWASLIATFPTLPSLAQWMPVVMIAFACLSCYLLLSEIPFFSLKFHDLTWANNKTRFVFLIGALALCVLCCICKKPLIAGSVIIVWYVIAAMGDLIEKKK